MSDKKDKEPTFSLVSQYVKDLSFENVKSVQQLEVTNEQPQIDVQLKVDIANGGEAGHYQVSLLTNIQAKLNDPMFVLELNYSGDFVLDGFPDDLLEGLLYIECPRLLFPFARHIIASTVSDGGFPPLYLSHVDFAELYRQQKESKNQTLQ